MNTSDGSLVKRRLIQVAIGLFVFMTFGCLVLTYVLAAVNIQYLPASDYIDEANYYAMASAAICAMFGFVQAANLPFDETKENGSKQLLAVLASPILFGIIGHQLVTTTIPLCAAALSGSEVDINYTIASPEYIEGKFCKTPILLAGMPTLNNTLCNFPAEFQQQLHPGSEIVVTGRGTSWGLFVRSARLADANQAGTP